MKFTFRKVHYLFFGIGIFLCGLYIASTKYVQVQVVKALNSVPAFTVHSSDVEVSLWNRSIRIRNLKYTTLEDSVSENLIYGYARSIHATKINFLSWYKQRQLHIGNLEIYNPVVVYQDPEIPIKKRKDGNKKTLSLPDCIIDKVQIFSGRMAYEKENTVVGGFSGGTIDIILSDVRTDTTNTIFSALPVTANLQDADIRNVNVQTDKHHQICIDRMLYSDRNLYFSHFQYEPIISVAQFLREISNEKDYVHLYVDSLAFLKTRLIRNDKIDLQSPEVTIDQLNLSVYRNKKIPDDTRKKPMYSKMLRQFAFPLQLDTVQITNSKITYKEQAENDNLPGLVSFDSISAQIYNLSNDSATTKNTQVQVAAKFFAQSPVVFKWNYNVNDPTDQFSFYGQAHKITDQSINAFVDPAINVKTKGLIDYLSFSFSGNNEEAMGKMKMKYDNFDVQIQKKDKTVNALLTRLANFIVGKKEKQGVLVEDKIKVRRDPERSFWNYVWLCIQKGLFKTVL